MYVTMAQKCKLSMIYAKYLWTAVIIEYHMLYFNIPCRARFWRAPIGSWAAWPPVPPPGTPIPDPLFESALGKKQLH
jgi:hypothetical protein